MTAEIWLPIPGWEGLYEASSLGRIRSLDRPKANPTGYGRGSKGRILAPVKSPNSPYWKVSLTDRSRRVQRFVHELVCCAFYGPKPMPHLEVRHLDDNKDNNASSNLCWGTCRENYDDSLRNGTRVRRKVSRALSSDEVRMIRKALRTLRPYAVAKMFDVSHSVVQGIATGATYRWVE
ncbi:MAG: NUMOD4 motif-containing HNH endonuclease [Burkholderia multivorans]|nr:NUMOD4 motif-containing HNH endonuclease [Burkholderia multivorans]